MRRFVTRWGGPGGICVHILWKLADRKSAKSCVVYLTKSKTSARSPALASAQIPPKICQGQLRTIYSEFPKFHPNPFTSGGVIAECVNIVETRHKVFPILCEASLPGNNVCYGMLWYKQNGMCFLLFWWASQYMDDCWFPGSSRYSSGSMERWLRAGIVKSNSQWFESYSCVSMVSRLY